MKTFYHFKELYLVFIEAADSIYSMHEEMLKFKIKHGENEKFNKAMKRLDAIIKLLNTYTTLVTVYESIILDNQIKDSRYLQLANEVEKLKKTLNSQS